MSNSRIKQPTFKNKLALIESGHLEIESNFTAEIESNNKNSYTIKRGKKIIPILKKIEI